MSRLLLITISTLGLWFGLVGVTQAQTIESANVDSGYQNYINNFTQVSARHCEVADGMFVHPFANGRMSCDPPPERISNRVKCPGYYDTPNRYDGCGYKSNQRRARWGIGYGFMGNMQPIRGY